MSHGGGTPGFLKVTGPIKLTLPISHSLKSSALYRESSYSATLNFLLLFSVVFGVATVTRPVVAPAGTTAVI